MITLKRMIAVFLVVFVSLNLIVPANALTGFNEDNEVFSEYDFYVSIKEKSKNSLNNLAPEEYAIANGAIEKELLKRSAMSDEQLYYYYGYNDSQIRILREYHGEPIESYPIIKGVLSATCSATYSIVSRSSSSLSVVVSWVWSSMPFFGGTDKIGLYASGVNSSSVAMALNFSSYNGSINYYTPNGAYMSNSSISLSKFSTNILYSTFAMTTSLDGVMNLYAKTGTVSLVISPTATGNPVYAYTLDFAYGHTTMVITPSLTFNGAGSFSVGTGTTLACHKNQTIYV